MDFPFSLFDRSSLLSAETPAMSDPLKFKLLYARSPPPPPPSLCIQVGRERKRDLLPPSSCQKGLWRRSTHLLRSNTKTVPVVSTKCGQHVTVLFALG